MRYVFPDTWSNVDVVGGRWKYDFFSKSALMFYCIIVFNFFLLDYIGGSDGMLFLWFVELMFVVAIMIDNFMLERVWVEVTNREYLVQPVNKKRGRR